MKLYFPEFINRLSGLKDSRKFWTYETEVILMTVIMKNVCCIGSMQQMTDTFIKEYRSICNFGGSDSLDGTAAETYPRKGKADKKLHME